MRDVGLSYRDALVAAAILPHLPDGEVLIRVCDEDERPAETGTPEGTLSEFMRRVSTVGGSSNLRRCRTSNMDIEDADDADHEVVFKPEPHGIRTYRLSLYDVDLLHPAYSDADEYDFDDTDQALLTDFGGGSSVLSAVGAQIKPYTFPRRPVFPTYNG